MSHLHIRNIHKHLAGSERGLEEADWGGLFDLVVGVQTLADKERAGAYVGVGKKLKPNFQTLKSKF